MIGEQDAKRILVVLRRMVRAQAILQSCAQELIGLFSGRPEMAHAAGGLANLLGSGQNKIKALFSQPIVDFGAMSITWRGRSCKLGNTVLFRLMERLARRPNFHLTYDRLIHDVWEGQCRSNENVRSAVRRLKDRLVQAGMPKLAAAIKSDRHQYHLDLAGQK